MSVELIAPARVAFRDHAKSGGFVVKIGSSVLASSAGALDAKRVLRIAREVLEVMGPKRWPVIVSSGAILAGMGELRLEARPKTMAGQQATAAVGQSQLMLAWARAFSKAEIPVAQVLLTHADLADRGRFLNARNALAEIQRRGAVAIINENDTVSTEEIAFGDNDGLAAQVANLVDARALVLLTSAPGFLDASGNRLSEALATDPRLDGFLRKDKSKHGKGGMGSKLAATRAAAARGTFVAIAPGDVPDVLPDLFAGYDVGTVFLPGDRADSMRSRAHWIAYTLRSRGTVRIDAGAARAIGREGRSLLPMGIVEVSGTFQAGDPVEIFEVGTEAPMARGLTRLDADVLRGLIGSRRVGHEVIHKDDLVLL